MKISASHHLKLRFHWNVKPALALFFKTKKKNCKDDLPLYRKVNI